MRNNFLGVAAAAALASTVAADANYTLSNQNEIRTTATSMAKDLVGFLKNGTSLLPEDKYYWFNNAALWASIIEFGHNTGDSTYASKALAAIASQYGDNADFAPEQQTLTEGNDDQAFWATTALLAAERGQDDPKGKPKWVDAAIKVYTTQQERYDAETACKGGLRWQIRAANSGYNYKNSISNGLFFNLAARLARYTGSQSYIDSAEKTWEWLELSGLLDNKTYSVYDGISTDSCDNVIKTELTMTNSVLALGAANLYNITKDDKQKMWQARLGNLTARATDRFFSKNILTETACEGTNTCSTDMDLMKGMLAQQYGQAMQLAPFISTDNMTELLQASAVAAARQCAFGDNGQTCGFNWLSGKGENKTANAMSQVSALNVVNSLMSSKAVAPYTNKTNPVNIPKDKGGKGTNGGKDGNDNASGRVEANAMLAAVLVLSSAAYYAL